MGDAGQLVDFSKLRYFLEDVRESTDFNYEEAKRILDSKKDNLTVENQSEL